ncbi:hypothetical protein F5Y04DRAFT_115530 [Hypomontagnella monticulosa]|nr:hypothetical protein F5Y04DRAFT_115530 [Hypomontagnella monticulosa]
MAVLEELPGVEITVQVAGRDATEYDHPDAREQQLDGAANVPTSNKFIECVDGSEFTITAKVRDTYKWGYKNHVLSLRFSADGKWLESPLMSQSDNYGGRLHIRVVEGHKAYCHQTKRWLLQRCKFSAISTVDDSKKERVEKDIKAAKDVGLIRCRIYRCIRLGASDFQPSIEKGTKSELAEKALKGKAISHGISFSSENTVAPSYSHAEDLTEDNGPIAIFQFHYRSRDALKREMVIPRTPSPGPAPDPEIARMSREELERLAEERLNQLRGIKEERKPVIKREIGDVVDLTDNSRRPKTRRRLNEPEEAIDLTED